MLLYGLMDSAPAPLFRRESVRSEATPINRDRFQLSTGASGGTEDVAPMADASLAKEPKQVPPKPFDTGRVDGAASVSKPQTDLDTLEDSFKFAVGIASSSKSKLKSHRKEGPRGSITGGGSLRAQDIDRTSRDVQEQVLLRDVLFALQAIESRNIYFDTIADRFQVAEDDHIPSRTYTSLA